MKRYVIVETKIADGRFAGNVNAEERGLQPISDEERIASATAACENHLGAGNYMLMGFLDDRTAKVLASIRVETKATAVVKG